MTGREGGRPGPPRRTPGAPRRIAYGEDPSQFGELTLPVDRCRGVVVVIHGGFWRSRYGLELARPLAADLAARGWAAWNLEYRRVGNGGGAPATFDDVASGIDLLADLHPALDLTAVVALGHSAGGHLAAWAASRPDDERRAGGVGVTAVVTQAGVLDLAAAHEQHLGDDAVLGLLGGPPGPDHAALDPRRQLPLPLPVRCVHGAADLTVPPSQSRDYVAAARAAGADAELVEVPGDHRGLIDPTSPAWARTAAVLDDLP